jgi:cytochrome c oxidase subunit 4
MTEHAVTEHAGHEHGVHDHPADAGHDHHNDPESIRKEVRRYLYVFGTLAVLTLITVGVSQLHLPTAEGIALALLIATIKGSLVAAFFMHLITERKLIYGVLVLTVFFFSVLMWGPWHHRYNAQHEYPGYDLNASSPAPAAPTDKPAHEHSGH